MRIFKKVPGTCWFPMTSGPRELVEKFSKSWCVILNQGTGELAKTGVGERLSRLLPVTSLQALELIESAPIILLENVSFEQASQVKACLEEGGGLEVLVTDDLLEKRKCLQVFWPEPPKLDRVGLGAQDSLPIEGDGSSQVVEEEASALRSLRERFEKTERDLQALRESRETLSREWREKELFLMAQLKSIRSDKENLLQELEALRLKNQVLSRQNREDVSSRAVTWEMERRTYEERVKSLEREYEEAEALWREKLQEKERLERQRFVQLKELQREHARLQDEFRAIQDRYSELDSQFQKWRRTQGALVETQKEKIEELTARKSELEKELEASREKIRGFSEGIRSQEDWEKKLKAQQSLKERELLLRELVHRQEVVERELRDREKELKLILARQEQVEKDLLEGRKED